MNSRSFVSKEKKEKKERLNNGIDPFWVELSF
jgi:hypothetical protein